MESGTDVYQDERAECKRQECERQSVGDISHRGESTSEGRSEGDERGPMAKVLFDGRNGGRVGMDGWQARV